MKLRGLVGGPLLVGGLEPGVPRPLNPALYRLNIRSYEPLKRLAAVGHAGRVYQVFPAIPAVLSVQVDHYLY